MTRQCPTPGCDRAPVPTSTNGTVHSSCPSCERAALTNAWYDHAAADVLRFAIVGGLPIEPGPELGGQAIGAVSPPAS